MLIPKKADITIIGAGPVGLMCAIYAVKNGLKPKVISLATAHQKTAGIAAGGMLAPAYESFENASDEMVEFSLLARDEWDEVSKSLNINIDAFALALGQSPQDLVRLEKIKSRAEKFGKKFEFVMPHDFLNAKYALNLSTDALINPIIAMAKMHEFCLEHGVEFVEDEILEIGARYLEGANAKYECDKVIIANGYCARQFLAQIPLLSKLQAVRGQTIEVDFLPKFLGSIRYQSTYLMARGNKLVIGATSQLGQEDWEIRQADKIDLFENAKKILPQLDDAKILNSFAGIRPLIAGEMPIIGQSEIENIYLAIGAYRNGWAYAPFMAKTLIENINNGAKIAQYLHGNQET